MTIRFLASLLSRLTLIFFLALNMNGALVVQVCAQTITLDGSQVGRTFDGLGAVSGGGNTTRFLPEYPAAQRNQILDYLFKPKFGASLNSLKVEVGGDVNSTEGSEPSHMHVRGDESYDRGFEWWLMEQAKARNPKIAFDCLAWGAPGWVGNGNYWSNDMMNYYIKFIKGAKTYHGIDIKCVGGKNESGYNTQWYIDFRKALDDNGLEDVQLVGSDDWGPPWLNIAKDSITNPALAKAVNVFGGHVTWSENPAVPSAAILATGKPLWDTEMHNYDGGSLNGLAGFRSELSLVHGFNVNYIKAKITKTQFWNLIWSYYPESSYPAVGMMAANTPWSGHYDVWPEVWGYAHINQFVEPGWKYLEGQGNGNLPGGGTYVALMSPDKSEYTSILETGDASAPQTIQFDTIGGLSAKSVHIWESNAQFQFVHVADRTPSDGAFTATLDPNCVYTISTTVGQHKGEYPAPPTDKPFPFPYLDSLTNYKIDSQARYLYDYEGCFEIEKSADGIGNCLTQDATKSASGWGGANYPYTFLGSGDWKDYSVSVDAYIEDAGAVSIHGRVNDPGGSKDPSGYTLRVQDNGAWVLKTQDNQLATGTAAFGANKWHNLKLSFNGSTIIASIDKQQVCSVTDSTYSSGQAGLGTGWNFAQFKNLSIGAN